MHLGEPKGKLAKRIVRGVLGSLVLLFVITFAKDFWPILGMLFNPAILPWEAFQSFGFVCLNCLFGFFVVFIIWTILISFQALLPITDITQNPRLSLLEAYRAGWYLIFYILRRHGPAIFVKNGEENATAEDLQRKDWPGVVVVDHNNAVVLEERNPPPGLMGALINIGIMILQGLRIVDIHESPRVRGAGIVFTRPRERIRGVVDLRKQWRSLPNVKCYTRDGIEVYARVWALFTAGQDPDILQVTYVGVPCAENLRVVNLHAMRDGFLRITGFSDDLDDEDKREIHAFFQGQTGDPNDALIPQEYQRLPNIQEGFNSERVYAAVNAKARNGNLDVIKWIDLPTQVAVEIYRDVLSKANYDELYDIRGEQGGFPLPRFRRKLGQRMRGSGILSFRFLYQTSGTELEAGRVYRERDLLVSQVRPLRNSKVLRDRGIKVIASSFGDVFPVNNEVYQQRLNAWRASWQLEFEKRMAPADLRSLQERGRAYAEAQEDLWLSLSRILERSQFAEEALALRIMQALDQAASDPATRALLPSNTLDAMRVINTLLLPPESPGIQQPGLPPSGGGNP